MAALPFFHPAPPRRAVFLDRDGTIIEEQDYLKDPGQVVLLPGAGGALRRLQDAGYRLIIITNQSGVGRGYFTMADVARCHARLETLLAEYQVRLDRIYVAPEAPGQPGRGRKPSPQFVFDARDEFGLDLAGCFMVGDKLVDLECGWNAGVGQSILVRTGYGAQLERQSPEQLARAWVVDDLSTAAEWILRSRGYAPATPSSFSSGA